MVLTNQPNVTDRFVQQQVFLLPLYILFFGFGKMAKTVRNKGKDWRKGGKGSGKTLVKKPCDDNVKCPHCQKTVKSASILRHISQCRCRTYSLARGDDNGNDVPAAVAVADFAYLDDNSIASNEYMEESESGTDPENQSNSRSNEQQCVVEEDNRIPTEVLVGGPRTYWMETLNIQDPDEECEWDGIGDCVNEGGVDEDGGQDNNEELYESEDENKSEHVNTPDEHELLDHFAALNGWTMAEVDGAVANDNSTDIGVLEEGVVDNSVWEESVDAQFSQITTRGLYKHCPEWSWLPPPLDTVTNTTLMAILTGKEGKTMGCCFESPLNTEPPLQLTNAELSMLRLIDFADMNHNRGRKFVDDFLDLIAEEMDTRGFNPRNRPTRELVSKKVMEVYGKGLEPSVARLTVSTEDRNMAHVEEDAENTRSDSRAKRTKRRNGNSEPDSDLLDIDAEQIEQSKRYAALPREINNRERYVVHVIRFDMENMLLDLLRDNGIFGNLENLVVNAENPYKPYKNTSGLSTELLDGTWYSDSLERLRKMDNDPFVDGMDFFLPVIMYLDKTGTSMNQRYPLEPILFTTAIIKRRLRNRPRSWRPLGYIPDLESKSSAEKKYMNDRNRGATAQSYHRVLDHVLEGFKLIQDNGIITWLRMGEYRKKVRIRPELACIIQDGKSADMITSRVPSTHADRRISRSCHALQRNCDQVCEDCKYVEMNANLEELFLVVGMSEKEIQEDPKYQEQIGGTVEKPNVQRVRDIIEGAKQSLDELSFHPVRNAFVHLCIRFGLDPRCIWGACPVDLMHAYQSGLLLYEVKMVLDSLPVTRQVQMDRLVHKIFHGLRCGEKQDYPRMNFAKGFSKLTLLTSDEWAGKLFVLLLALHTHEGKTIFGSTKIFSNHDTEMPPSFNSDEDLATQARDLTEIATELVEKEERKASKKTQERHSAKSRSTEEEPEEMLRPCSKTDFTELAEALLCFHAWYKRAELRLNEGGKVNTEAIQASVQKLLAMVRWYTPRKKGNGWKLQKFHDLLHLAKDIERFGPPANFDAGPHESGLRYWAKLPAQTSQMRGYNTFAIQTAMRVYEFQCIAKALHSNDIMSVRDLALDGLERKERAMKQDNGKANVGGTRYRIYRSSPTGTSSNETGVFRQSKAFRKRTAKGSFVVSPVIEDFLRLRQQAADYLGPRKVGHDEFWELHTELSAVFPDENNRVTIRCHPNYQNEGPWNDWVMAKFETGSLIFEESENETQFYQELVPCKVLAIAETSNGDVRLLVHGCSFRTTRKERDDDTVLIEFWNLEYSYRTNQRRTEGMVPHLTWVSISNIHCRCLVIEEEPGIHEVVPISKEKKPLTRVMLVRRHSLWPEEFTLG